jgi:hypothetical protein
MLSIYEAQQIMSKLVSNNSFSISENDYKQNFKMIPIKKDGHCQFSAVCHDPRVKTLMQQANVDTSSDIDMTNWLRDQVVKVIASDTGKYSVLMAGADAINIDEYMKNISWKAPTLKFLQEKQLPLSKEALNAGTENQKIYWAGIMNLKPKLNQTRSRV